MLNPEIKYRAYWKGVNQMRYFDSGKIDYVGDSSEGNWGIFIPLSNINKEQSVFMGSCEVMPFIGIRDKNGKEIYAGDIIISQEFSTRPYSSKAKHKRFIGIVEYQIGEGNFSGGGEKDRFLQYSAGWGATFEDRGNYRCGAWDDFFDCEVIGNIFENPEKAPTELLTKLQERWKRKEEEISERNKQIQ